MTPNESSKTIREVLIAAGWRSEEIAALLYEETPKANRNKGAAAEVLKAAGWSFEEVTAALWEGLRI